MSFLRSSNKSHSGSSARYVLSRKTVPLIWYSPTEATSLDTFRVRNPRITKYTLSILARADALRSLNLSRRNAHWQVQALAAEPAPLDTLFTTRSDDATSQLLPLSEQAEMFSYFESHGLSLRAHPCSFIRTNLDKKRCNTIESLHVRYSIKASTRVSVGGLVITRQRPGTAKGIVFLTLEDETGTVYIIIRPKLFTEQRQLVMYSTALLAHGTLQRIGEVIYPEACSLSALALDAVRDDTYSCYSV